MTATQIAAKPLATVGSFYAMAMDTLFSIPRRPFAWREFFVQSWFVARVSLAPALMLAIPFTVLNVYTLSILLIEFRGRLLRYRRSHRYRHADRPDRHGVGRSWGRRDRDVRRPAVVVPSGHFDGRRGDVGAHLLRVQRVRRPCWRRRGRGARRADVARRGRLRDHVVLPGDLRTVGQIQPIGLTTRPVGEFPNRPNEREAVQ